MLLAIDTATRWTALALHDGSAVIAETGWHAHKTQTVELAPAVAAMLGRASLTAADLRGIAVAIGPGSYTGLRVGLGLAKGLALAHGIPLVGVPTLDIVAAAIGEMPGRLVSVAEAGRSRICVGLYRWQGSKGWQSAGDLAIVTWDELLAGLQPAEAVQPVEPVAFAGEISPEAAKRLRVEARKGEGPKITLLPPAAGLRRAGFLAEIAWWRLRRNRVDDAATLAPIYLRDPAA